MVGRAVVGAALGAGLGAAWWGLRELIASGAVCSKENWDCLAVGLFAIPVSLLAGVLLAWLVLAAAHQQRPLGFAAVGVTFTAVLTLLTVWVSVPAGGLLAGAVGFVLAAPVTARHPVGDTAARD